MLEKLEIKHNATEYIKKELRFAGDFGKSVAEHLNLEKGRVFVYLPPVLHSYIEEFQNSILSIFREFDGDSIDKEIIINEIKTKPQQIVSQYLQINTRGCAIFETFHLASNTNKKHIEVRPYLIHNNAVFWFLIHDNANIETVNQCFKTRKAYPSIVGLSTIPTSWKFINTGQEVQSETIQLLAKGVEYLLVGSYDEETFLIWESDMLQNSKLMV